MECTIDPRDDSGYRKSHYLSRDVLPQKLSARRFSLRGTYPVSGEDVTILYVEKGEGEARINGRRYALKPGTMIVFYPFFICELIGSRERPLQGVECIVNMGAMFFMFSIPAYRLPVRILEGAGHFYDLAEEEEKVGGYFEDILRENNSTDCYFERIQFSLLMKVMAVAGQNRGQAEPW